MRRVATEGRGRDGTGGACRGELPLLRRTATEGRGGFGIAGFFDFSVDLRRPSLLGTRGTDLVRVGSVGTEAAVFSVGEAWCAIDAAGVKLGAEKRVAGFDTAVPTTAAAVAAAGLFELGNMTDAGRSGSEGLVLNVDAVVAPLVDGVVSVRVMKSGTPHAEVEATCFSFLPVPLLSKSRSSTVVLWKSLRRLCMTRIATASMPRTMTRKKALAPSAARIAYVACLEAVSSMPPVETAKSVRVSGVGGCMC